MTAHRGHAQVRTRFFQMSQECLSLQANSHHNPQRGTTIGWPTDWTFERMNGCLSARLPLPAWPSLCVYLLVRPISSLARLCDWNKNEACTNLQTAKRARTFRPIYPLSLFVCACPFAVVLPLVLVFIPSVFVLCRLFLSLLPSELDALPSVSQWCQAFTAIP